MEYLYNRLSDAAFWTIIIWNLALALYFSSKSIIGYLLGDQDSKKTEVEDE